MLSANSKPAQSEIETEQRSLDLFLSNQYGFRLGLALYNDVVARRAHIEQTRTALAAKSIELVIVDLQTFDKEAQLLACAQKQIESLNLSAEQRLAVMVVGLEGRVNYSPELSDYDTREGRFLANANFQRELWPQGCPHPTVLWMTETLERAFVAQAPDLWHWRSQVFDLRGMVAPILDAILQPYGSAAFDLAHPISRIEHLEESLAAYKKSGNQLGILDMLNGLGKARMENGEVNAARIDFEGLLKLSRDFRNTSMESSALGNLGTIKMAVGDLNSATKDLKLALKISQKQGYRLSEGFQLSTLGSIYLKQKKFQKSIETQEQALDIAIESNDLIAQSARLGNLANAYSQLHNFDKAINLYQESLAIAKRTSDRRSVGSNLGNLGLVFFHQGEISKAIDHYSQAIVIDKEVGAKAEEGLHLLQLATLLWSHSEPLKQAEYLQMAEDGYALLKHVQSPLAKAAPKLIQSWRKEIANTNHLTSADSPAPQSHPPQSEPRPLPLGIWAA